MDIDGKKAIVFGGTSGIGLSATQMLSDKGAHVVALSRNPEKLQNVPKNVTTKKMNVLDRDALEQFFEEIGEYDILVNSATGGARGTKYLKNNGNIVLVSGSPARKCRPGQIAISSVGGAVEAFARGIAPEIAPKRINIVSPGIIDTPMSPLQGKEREDYYKNTTNNNLIPRAGTPDEVATGIIFAIENEFITGTTIDIDGGWLIS